MRRFLRLIRAQAGNCLELRLLELIPGLRRGEVLVLQWSDLNSRTGALRVEQRAQYV